MKARSMNERAFKLDFYIAVAAILLSVITTAALIYQTSVMRDQYAATVWPYLSVDSSYDQDGVILSLSNDGFGPALIKSASLTLDGKPATTWDDYIKILFTDPLMKPNIHKHMKVELVTTSVDGATIVRPNQDLQLFKFDVPNSHPAVIRHTVDMKFCYCSLNGNCWTLHATPGRSLGHTPQPVSQCTEASRIDSPVKTFRMPQ